MIKIFGKLKIKELLNKVKFKLLEIMIMGKDIEELRKSALKMAKEETLEEFDRRYTTKYGIPPSELSSSNARINRGNDKYKEFIKENKQEYDEMIKLRYEKWLMELKRMWYFKNLDKLIPQEDKSNP